MYKCGCSKRCNYKQKKREKYNANNHEQYRIMAEERREAAYNKKHRYDSPVIEFTKYDWLAKYFCMDDSPAKTL